MSVDNRSDRLRVLIAGGGIAGLEAMMALRALAGDRVAITLLAPEREFRFRPMAVNEPFTIARARQMDLAAVAADFGATLIPGALAAVTPGERHVTTGAGERIDYDALVVACGTRLRPALDGVITIDDRNLGGTLRGLVQDVEEGYTSRIAFVAPAQAFWPLPLYELALLTANRAFDMNVPVEIAIVSPESAPLELFGAGISHELASLLQAAGIAFHDSSFAELAHGQLTLQPGGLRLRPERIVALPLLEGTQIAGIPTDAHGFVAVDELGRVRGVDGVYAAGDVTAHPIKHGGLAAQQADVVAAAIAAQAGAPVEPRPLEPVIRGMLLTGDVTRYFEAQLGDEGFVSTVSDVCPWDPPVKVVARHLGPYIAHGDRAAAHA
ncbi:MAG: FAD-dependent oxidoreductase [Thermoleophilia bacterium]